MPAQAKPEHLPRAPARMTLDLSQAFDAASEAVVEYIEATCDPPPSVDRSKLARVIEHAVIAEVCRSKFPSILASQLSFTVDKTLATGGGGETPTRPHRSTPAPPLGIPRTIDTDSHRETAGHPAKRVRLANGDGCP